ARSDGDLCVQACADDPQVAVHAIRNLARIGMGLEALVVSSPDLGTALADRMLGPVLGLEPADRELLLTTLAAWLEAGGSARRAGALLFCHRNTVLNRLRRYEQLTGRSLDHPREVMELSLALSAHRLLTP
ncbi:helix-turn-helix domain-containing protein, partial [Streptomyces asiaticus]